MRPAFAAFGAGLLALSMAPPAGAVPVQLDFEGFAPGDVVSGPGVFPGVTFSTDATLVVFEMNPAPPDLSGARVVEADPFDHADPVRADFASAATAVSVAMGDFGSDEDSLFLRAFDGTGNLLDEDVFVLASTTDGGPTLSVSAAAIAYVLFGSDGAFPNSFYFDNFTFELAETREVPVPEPTSLALAAAALGGLALARRRRR